MRTRPEHASIQCVTVIQRETQRERETEGERERHIATAIANCASEFLHRKPISYELSSKLEPLSWTVFLRVHVPK